MNYETSPLCQGGEPPLTPPLQGGEGGGLISRHSLLSSAYLELERTHANASNRLSHFVDQPRNPLHIGN